ncbi:MAG: pyridoxine 5'-phosphate synthase [Chthoniobacteraceae bacterium]|nr:pyridoxine 5'-phosphate synthase [Chthoniobacteraceae bacterium]
MNTLLLGVNIDHIATLRQARYPGMLDSPNCEPDLLAAAAICEKAGASGITTHLRADRRHIQDEDVYRLRKSLKTKMNLEMGNTPEIVEIALRVKPEDVCLVPENRREITTEGGLDAAGQLDALTPTVRRLNDAGIHVSLFIEPAFPQIDAAVKLHAHSVELHTGAFANTQGEAHAAELARIREAAAYAHERGLQVNAGHGINYVNIAEIREVPYLTELNIGHTIISRAIFAGLEAAVKELIAAMRG